jgi:hypothetical protein
MVMYGRVKQTSVPRLGFIRLRRKNRVDESVEEAKNPGAMLGLIMGIYPLLLIGFILLVIAYGYFVQPFLSGPIDREEHLEKATSTTLSP